METIKLIPETTKKHLSGNILCELAEMIANDSIKNAQLNPVQEQGRKHAFFCDECLDRLMGLARKLKGSFEGDTSLLNEEGASIDDREVLPTLAEELSN